MIDLQQQTYAIYQHLMALRRDWPGQLILATELDAQGQALAFAAIAAGAACLTIDADPDLCRAATRSGSVDFLVNTVDEALRVLKNEIRKHNPLSVALQAHPEGALAELEQRGVYPALFAGDQAFPAAAQGMAPGEVETIILTCNSSAELRASDDRLRQVIAPEDPRQRWIGAAARLFHRDRRRVITLSDAEQSLYAKPYSITP